MSDKSIAMKNSQAGSFDQRTAGSVFTRYGLGFFIIILAVVFSFAIPQFASVNNILNIISSTCVTGITGMGLSLIVMCGEIDFACGLETVVGALVVGTILDSTVFHNYVLAFAAAMAFAVGFGLLNAFMNVKIGIPAFIATMGTSLVVQGIVHWKTNSSVLFSNRWPDSFTFLGQGYVFGVIPVPVIVLVVIGLILWIFTNRTRTGKKLYAVGANPKACAYVGIDAKKIKILGFVLCAVLCAIGGIVNASMLNRVSPYAGSFTMLNSITAVMLGATFLKPGVYNILGTILGAFLVTMLTNAFTMMGADSSLRDIIEGAVMLVAVTVVWIVKRKAERA